MGVHHDSSRRKYVVRWMHDGRRRTRRFAAEAEALAFAATLESNTARRDSVASATEPSRGDGIYRYDTKDGPRWRFVFIQSDGTRSSRRGFSPAASSGSWRPGCSPATTLVVGNE